MTDPTPTTSTHPAEPGTPPARAGDPEDPGMWVANPQPELEASPEDPSSGPAPAPTSAQADPAQPVPSDSAPPLPPAPGPAPPLPPAPESAPPSAPGPESVPSPTPDQGLEGDPTAWPPDEAFEAVELDDRGWSRRDLEAILLVADEPVPAQVLAEIVGSRLSEVEELLVDLAGEYARDGRGFVLRAVAGGWRLYTHPGARAAVEAFLKAGQQSRLTRAALETLAVIAYRQPVTRFQVAAVRGVNVDGVFRTLASRGLIHEVGTDPGPGQATLYGTTPAFLEQLGLNDLDQLPPIKDYLPEGVELLDLQEQS
jgi:segregation and condensation protein B